MRVFKSCYEKMLYKSVLICLPSDLLKSWYNDGSTNQLVNNFHFVQNQTIRMEP